MANKYLLKNVNSGATFYTDDEGLAVIKTKGKFSNFKILEQTTAFPGQNFVPDIVKRMRDKNAETTKQDETPEQLEIPDLKNQGEPDKPAAGKKTATKRTT